MAVTPAASIQDLTSLPSPEGEPVRYSEVAREGPPCVGLEDAADKVEDEGRGQPWAGGTPLPFEEGAVRTLLGQAGPWVAGSYNLLGESGPGKQERSYHEDDRRPKRRSRVKKCVERAKSVAFLRLCSHLWVKFSDFES